MKKVSEIYIKGMVCNRCISTIKEMLIHKGYSIQSISLGKVIFNESFEVSKKGQVSAILSPLGFELISDKNEQLLENIKVAIDEWTTATENGFKPFKLSNFLSQKFSKNYDSLGEFFSRHEGMTIEHYFIAKRLEKVKELLVYTDLPLSAIAFQTGFSSAYHLSAQFKKNTGMPPSALRAIRKEKSASMQRV